MAFTVQQVCDRARIFIKDADKVRVSDSDMAGFVNDAVQILAVNRPDLFIGSYLNLPAGNLGFDDPLPLEDRFIPSVVDWVIARSESIEDEYTIDGRAVAFYQLAGINQGGRK